MTTPTTVKAPCAGVRRRALQILAQRMHGIGELEQKLRARFEAPCVGTIQQVVAELAQLGYCDDQAFAEMFIRVRQQRGFGPRRIALELQQKGIAKALSQRLLQQVHWQAILEKEWQAFGFEKDLLLRQKAKRRFYQRGFPGDVIAQVEKKLVIRRS